MVFGVTVGVAFFSPAVNYLTSAGLPSSLPCAQMCDAVKADGAKCDKPVKADGKCGIHKAKAVADPVDAIATGVAAIDTHDPDDDDVLRYEEEEERDSDDDAGSDAPAGGAGAPGKKTKAEKDAEAITLAMYKTKALGDMTPAEKDSALIFFRDFHARTLSKRAEAQKKTREKNKGKGLTGSGKKKVTPWEATANRAAGTMRSSGISEDIISAQMTTLVATELAKHKAKCAGCEHPHA